LANVGEDASREKKVESRYRCEITLGKVKIDVAVNKLLGDRDEDGDGDELLPLKLSEAQSQEKLPKARVVYITRGELGNNNGERSRLRSKRETVFGSDGPTLNNTGYFPG